jgi:hypothetical protein
VKEEETCERHCVLIHKRDEIRNFTKDWIMKDCDSRISWIGGEGIPSRDHVSEKREQR